MKFAATIVSCVILVLHWALSSPAWAQEPPAKLQSLRGDTPIDKTTDADALKAPRDGPRIPRDFAQQPPLIPHSAGDYEITTSFNTCLGCHAWSRAREIGATKVSITHFKDATGQEPANISPGRYFCTQCHVPQTDAKPLVNNTFRPLPQIAGPK